MLDIHLSRPPGHVRWLRANNRAGYRVLLSQGVDVINENGHPHSGPALPALAQENLDIDPRNASGSRRPSSIPLLCKAQLAHVIVNRRGEIPDVEDWDGTPECIHAEPPRLKALSDFVQLPIPL